MSDDYGFSGKRKTKNDKRAKRRFNLYKRGGSQRSQKFERKDDESQGEKKK